MNEVSILPQLADNSPFGRREEGEGRERHEQGLACRDLLLRLLLVPPIAHCCFASQYQQLLNNIHLYII